MKLGKRYIDTSVVRILSLHVFSFGESYPFLHDSDILSDTVFTMDDEVSLSYMEEEIEIPYARFSYTIFEKYLRDDIISDYGSL